MGTYFTVNQLTFTLVGWTAIRLFMSAVVSTDRHSAHNSKILDQNAILSYEWYKNKSPHVYGIVLSLCFTEWNPNGQRQPGSICDWKFRGSSGSISSPDHWLPAGTECRYVFGVTSGRYLEFIVNIYGLRYVPTLHKLNVQCF